jgi:hypothetical protein
MLASAEEEIEAARRRDQAEEIARRADLIREGAPTDTLIRIPHDAEVAAAAWMRFWGHQDVTVAAPGADGGIDVSSSEAVAQVKAETAPLGRPVAQALLGAATAEGKAALLFSLGGFTAQALEWATRAGVAAFLFDLQGNPVPVNEHAAAVALRRQPTADSSPSPSTVLREQQTAARKPKPRPRVADESWRQPPGVVIPATEGHPQLIALRWTRVDPRRQALAVAERDRVLAALNRAEGIEQTTVRTRIELMDQDDVRVALERLVVAGAAVGRARSVTESAIAEVEGSHDLAAGGADLAALTSQLAQLSAVLESTTLTPQEAARLEDLNDEELREEYLHEWIAHRGAAAYWRRLLVADVLDRVRSCDALPSPGDDGWNHLLCKHEPAYSSVSEVDALPRDLLSIYSEALGDLAPPS